MTWPGVIENIFLFSGTGYLVVNYGWSKWWFLAAAIICNKGKAQ